MARLIGATAAATLALAGCATAEVNPARSASSCHASTDANRRIVLAFYNEGLVGHRPRAAFERYMTADFVEHKPDVPQGTREATAAFLERLMGNLPQARWEMVRTIAEDDLVFLHARFTPAAGAPPYAIADVFRLRHCRIAEHWDVVAPPPEEQRNPNPRF